MPNSAIIRVEQMSIPTYPIMECERMPMFNENRMHQGTSGNPYPVMPVLSVVRENCQPKDYEVVRMENDFIRLILIPELGGRVFEAYDKVNHYDFLYRQHVIKPALIGAYGLWISGGLEFNWPFHHRPSTFMPVNFSIETEADGTVITWLSECDPTDRTSSTVGIVLHPDAAFFETRIQVNNCTPIRHSFLMWQNAAVPVNDDYQFIFPPDVNYVNNHYSMRKPPMTYPIAEGVYASAYYDEPTDISWYKNCFHATSHFAAPSKYDFFGGYDHGKKCGIIHVADHHVSPGKKMFTWGCGELAESWEKALTDADGRYCELMAGSYSNNQPDFTWLNPYETKCFSEFWYPIGAVGKTSFATLDAAATVVLGEGILRVQTTRSQRDMRIRLTSEGKELLNATCSTEPCKPIELSFEAAEGMYALQITDSQGVELLSYVQEKNDELHYPEPLDLDPHPDAIQSVQELYLQGVHVDQYRHCQIRPDVYFEEALRRDPKHLPTLIALGEYRYRNGFYLEAEALLRRALDVEHTCNLRYADGETDYLLGLTLDAQGKTAEAYDQFYTAAWSGATVAKAMSKIAAIDGRNRDYKKMLEHAAVALESAARHPLASVYAALAEWKLGREAAAMERLDRALGFDLMNDFAAYVKVLLEGGAVPEFAASRRSDFSQIALDIAFDLIDGGFESEAESLLANTPDPTTPMIGYTLAWLQDKNGRCCQPALDMARFCEPRNIFPYRLDEIRVLKWAAGKGADPKAKDLLACALYGHGHYEEAAGLWREATQLEPGSPLYLRNLAVALFSHMERRDEAIALLERAAGLKEDNLQLMTEYLYAATKRGTPGEERLRAIEAHPVSGRKSDDFVLEHAKACCVAGRYDDALKVMLSHNFVPAEGGEMAINSVYFSIMLHKGRKLMEAGDLEAALETIHSIRDLPENLHSGLWSETNLVPLFYYEALCLEQMGRREESLEMYRLTLKRFNPALPDLAFYYASALRALGRSVEARVYLSRTVRALETRMHTRPIGWEDYTAAFNCYMNNPSEQRTGMCKFYLGMIERYEGNLEKAKALLEESRRLWPENLNTWVELDFLK